MLVKGVSAGRREMFSHIYEAWFVKQSLRISRGNAVAGTISVHRHKLVPAPELVLMVGPQHPLHLDVPFLLSVNSVHLPVILGTVGESYRLD